MLEREDSPWYPTMRLFRQTALGDWTESSQRMRGGAAGTRRPNRPCSAAAISAIPVGIAPGELLDKITILQIKLERIRDPDKLANVRYEHEQLKATAGSVSARDAGTRTADRSIEAGQ